MNVLITNVGRRGYLVDYLKRLQNLITNVYVSDCDNTASGLYSNNDGKFLLPRPADNEELYIEKLTKLCKDKDISVVFPVIDPEIFILSKYKNHFKKEGITVIVSDSKVLDICYDKINMNRFLDDSGLLYPKTYTSLDLFIEALRKGDIKFPVIVKPIYGSGSVETTIVSDKNKACALFHDGMMIQEVIIGQEYGIDVLNDLEKKPIRCTIKKKLSMRSGETDKAVTVKDNNILETAKKLALSLGHVGNLDFDVIVRDKKVFIIDLNPRFGGGYPATHTAGNDYIELILRMVKGESIPPLFNTYQEGLLIMKTIGICSVKYSEIQMIESV